MKKTIIVIILAVYIASIAIVNFFGLEVTVADSETYISFIEIVDITNIKSDETLEYTREEGYELPIYQFDFVPPEDGESYTLENIDTNPNMLQINFLLMSNKDEIMAYEDGMIKIDYDNTQNVAVYDEELCVLVFLKPVTITIYIRSTDLMGAVTAIDIEPIAP